MDRLIYTYLRSNRYEYLEILLLWEAKIRICWTRQALWNVIQLLLAHCAYTIRLWLHNGSVGAHQRSLLWLLFESDRIRFLHLTLQLRTFWIVFDVWLNLISEPQHGCNLEYIEGRKKWSNRVLNSFCRYQLYNTNCVDEHLWTVFSLANMCLCLCTVLQRKSHRNAKWHLSENIEHSTTSFLKFFSVICFFFDIRKINKTGTESQAQSAENSLKANYYNSSALLISIRIDLLRVVD